MAADKENLGVNAALGLIAEELDSATEKFGPFVSPHEGIGIILEEFLELMAAVFWGVDLRGGEGDPMKEATQLGAMAARFLVDCSKVGQATEEEEDTEGEATAEAIEALGGAAPKYGDPRGRSPGAVLFKILAQTLEKAHESVRSLRCEDPGDQKWQASAVTQLGRAYRLVRDVTDALDGAKQGGNDGDSHEARD